jgi:hypothetical protein
MMMFPYKLCGIYLLCGSSNPQYIGSEVHIDYNTIRFTTKERKRGIHLTKHIYGSISINEEKVKVIWVNSGKYEIDLGILPLITYPYTSVGCKRMNCEFTMDETSNWITVTHKQDHYVLRRKLYPETKEDTLLKIFFTQLLLDLIIRHIG